MAHPVSFGTKSIFNVDMSKKSEELSPKDAGGISPAEAGGDGTLLRNVYCISCPERSVLSGYEEVRRIVSAGLTQTLTFAFIFEPRVGDESAVLLFRISLFAAHISWGLLSGVIGNWPTQRSAGLSELSQQ